MTECVVKVETWNIEGGIKMKGLAVLFFWVFVAFLVWVIVA